MTIITKQSDNYIHELSLGNSHKLLKVMVGGGGGATTVAVTTTWVGVGNEIGRVSILNEVVLFLIGERA